MPLDTELGEIELKGNTDGTLIGNIGDRLKITGDGGSAADAPGCPITSKKFRVEFDDTDVAITSTFATVFTYSGSGKLFSASIKFNGEDINLRLKIDGEIIFNLNAKDVKDHQSNNRSQAVNIFNQNTGLWSIDFFCPIVFAATVLFEAQTSSGGDKTMERTLIALTKET